MVQRVRALVVLLLAATCLFVLAGTAAADTYTVDASTASNDQADATPNDGVCSVGDKCTLRAAVQTANGHAGADSIVIPANADPYTLTIGGADPAGDPAAAGDLDITDDVTITGAGAADTVIDASDLNDR